MHDRWKMNRAGLLNFWYYDEAEFVLEDGRLILRGANASGKSVTMQSFIPLVLDGDKRPWRLDPFGSRDRRIEYYLLLEGEDGHSERTAYLYLEFRHESLDRYLTVGIGLRARRNMAGIGFWGFVITDNRRIGRDFQLYRLEHGSGGNAKIPLSRSELEAAIGEGGRVVSEQGEYKRLVSKHLFGYADESSFEELLDLLIQLRSPKLSKDFKPTTIYEILTAALPALQEEDLRPLEEVLSDMDEIADHLAELAAHRAEVGRLQGAYGTYNEVLLVSACRAVLLQVKERNEAAGGLAGLQRELEASGACIAAVEAERDAQAAEERAIEARLETLSHHEAIGKEDELRRAKEQIQRLDNDKSSAMRRRNLATQRFKEAQSKVDALGNSLAKAKEQQVELLAEMCVKAHNAGFLLHDVHVQPWQDGAEPAKIDWEDWRHDLKDWMRLLQQALQLAGVVREKAHERAVAERQLGEARRRRDDAETGLRRQERAWDEAVESYQEETLAWRRSLRELQLAEETVQEVLRRAARYRETGEGAIDAPLRAVVEDQSHRLAQERMTLEHEKNRQDDCRQQLLAELHIWEGEKDPEPPRSEERKHSRRHREKTGAPLYALCEFRPEVDAGTRAALESVLQQAGLLDAWVQEGGMTAFASDEEEVWIEPSPVLFRCTLADYLQPTGRSSGGRPPIADVDSILRTIPVDPVESPSLTPTLVPDPVWVSTNGAYRLGALVGQAAPKARAEYIGEETRRRTRSEKMAGLRVEVSRVEELISGLVTQTASLDARAACLTHELATFPRPIHLAEVDSVLRSLQATYTACLAQLEQDQKAFQTAIEAWQQAMAVFKDATSGWNVRPDEEGIQTALRGCQDYGDLLGDLTTSWTIYRRDQDDHRRWLAEGETSALAAVEEEERLLELEDGRGQLTARVETLEALLSRLGLSEVHRQLEELRRHRQECGDRQRFLVKQVQEEQLAMARREVERQAADERLAVAEKSCDDALARWRQEWQLGLVADWAEKRPEPPSENEAVVSLCHEVLRAYPRLLEQKPLGSIKNALYEAFYATNQVLQDYVPETREESDGERILVVFMRDRQNPVTPLRLLRELEAAEEEQRLLLSVKDRELFEQVILHSVGQAIRRRIYRAEEWVARINDLMAARTTSSGFKLHLRWDPQPAQSERELDTAHLVSLLKADTHLLREEQIDRIVEHFRARVQWAKDDLEDRETLKDRIRGLLDYRSWFRFTLYYQKGQDPRRELTDARFNVLSGGEKAMAMYVPLLSAVHSRYLDAKSSAPRIISLDEAFAGVDDENLRDMFELLTQLDLDYMMTSQALWGCYDTVPHLSIYELLRPMNARFVALVRYRWNGRRRELVDELAGDEG